MKRWVGVQVRYPQAVWETAREEYRLRVCERGGRFLPDASNGGDVVVAVFSEDEAATPAEAAIRAIQAIQSDGRAAGVGDPTAIDVGSVEKPPSQTMRYARGQS